jgi:ubiquinone/menaquinone biosynthesis C-methylase UbiE
MEDKMTHEVENEQCGARVCPHKMAFILDNWFRKLLQNPTKITGEYINEGDTVIDIGCGPGYFTIAMAGMIGQQGKIIAVDLQEEMLEHVKRKAQAKNFSDRIHFHHCEQDRLGLEVNEKADFMLAYYMVHELPNPGAFFQEVRPLLKTGGKFLVVEPKWHVTQAKYEEMLTLAEKAGFRILTFPKKKGGRSVLLT